MNEMLSLGALEFFNVATSNGHVRPLSNMYLGSFVLGGEGEHH